MMNTILSKIKKWYDPRALGYYIMMILCLVIMGASWILNMGWVRMLLTWLAFPIIHAVVFAIINGKAISKLVYSAKLKIYTLISYATYVLAYVFFPDGGDEGTMYVFFGLIHNNTVAFIAGIFSVLCFAIYIIFTTDQLKEMSRIKKTLARELTNQLKGGEADQPLS